MESKVSPILRNCCLTSCQGLEVPRGRRIGRIGRIGRIVVLSGRHRVRVPLGFKSQGSRDIHIEYSIYWTPPGPQSYAHANRGS